MYEFRQRKVSKILKCRNEGFFHPFWEFPLVFCYIFSITQKCDKPKRCKGDFSSVCKLPLMNFPRRGFRAMMLSYAPKIVVLLTNLTGRSENRLFKSLRE